MNPPSFLHKSKFYSFFKHWFSTITVKILVIPQMNYIYLISLLRLNLLDPSIINYLRFYYFFQHQITNSHRTLWFHQKSIVNSSVYNFVFHSKNWWSYQQFFENGSLSPHVVINFHLTEYHGAHHNTQNMCDYYMCAVQTSLKTNCKGVEAHVHNK